MLLVAADSQCVMTNFKMLQCCNIVLQCPCYNSSRCNMGMVGPLNPGEIGRAATGDGCFAVFSYICVHLRFAAANRN